MNMNVGLNTNLNNFQSNLVDIINNSGLPVGVVYYIIKDLFTDIKSAYETAIRNEKEEFEKKKLQQNDDKDSENVE